MSRTLFDVTVNDLLEGCDLPRAVRIIDAVNEMSLAALYFPGYPPPDWERKKRRWRKLLDKRDIEYYAKHPAAARAETPLFD